VSSINEIENPLIRETLKYCNLRDYIDFNSSIDIPSRTGLGGSSSYCTGMVHLIKSIGGEKLNKKDIAKAAIHIERNILKDSGGIQDQILSSYGGFNTIKIDTKGNFTVKPLPISDTFKKKFQDSIVLIYTNSQRGKDEIAKSHEYKDKKNILALAHKAYKAFLKEDIKEIGTLLFEAWKEKRAISPLISTKEIDGVVDTVMGMGAYGVKLLGSGGCGFLMVICNPAVKKKILRKFGKDILEIEFEDQGTSIVYPMNADV
jgi:D-glycero-alpha-D-manno-heptose-7-phosphate kinase